MDSSMYRRYLIRCLDREKCEYIEDLDVIVPAW